jgi:signal transduction histidine kinase
MSVIAEEAVTEAKINNPGRWIKRSSAGSGAGEWDHDRVLQLVSNLLAHALERSARDSPVSFAWSGTAHGVLVEVEYEPDALCGERDMGLGLSVARHIALAHGGDIRVGETSAGARLTVDLPRRIPARRGKSGARGLRIVHERSEA